MQFSGSSHPHQTSAKTTSGYENLLQLCFDVTVPIAMQKQQLVKVTGCSHSTLLYDWLLEDRAIKADRK